MLVVVKIGSSSVTTPRGEVNETAIAKLCSEVAEQMGNGVQVVVVTSGAIAAGIDAAGIDFGSAGRSEENRPTDLPTLQAIASVGQPKLMRVYGQWLARYGLVLGQVLLTPLDFQDRRQYLHARRTVARLLALGVVPIVNENDVTADDEIRFGDNDRLAALVAHMVGADLLVILTDTAGVFTADPRIGENASLIEEVTEIDHQLEQAAGGAGSAVGSGGMVSKLAAAKIACWSGIRVVIADAKKTGVLAGAVAGESGVGTIIYPKDRRLSSRKLWLAFAVAPAGSVTIDAGAMGALVGRGTSLLPAGVNTVEGDFEIGDVVEVLGPQGSVVAKGVVRHSSKQLVELAGRKSSDLSDDISRETIHRDDMVILE